MFGEFTYSVHHYKTLVQTFVYSGCLLDIVDSVFL